MVKIKGQNHKATQCSDSALTPELHISKFDGSTKHVP